MSRVTADLRVDYTLQHRRAKFSHIDRKIRGRALAAMTVVRRQERSAPSIAPGDPWTLSDPSPLTPFAPALPDRRLSRQSRGENMSPIPQALPPSTMAPLMSHRSSQD